MPAQILISEDLANVNSAKRARSPDGGSDDSPKVVGVFTSSNPVYSQ
jgi:hypothetical protein